MEDKELVVLRTIAVILVVAVPFVLFGVGIYCIQTGIYINSMPYATQSGSGQIFTGICMILIDCFASYKLIKWAIKNHKEEKERKRLAAIKEAELKRQQAAEAEKKKQKKDAIFQQLKEGKWVFPSKNFYKQCYEKKISPLDGEYGLAKAKDVAKNVIQGVAYGIDIQHFTAYLTDDKLKNYYLDGKAADQAETKNKNKRIYESEAYNSEEYKYALAVQKLHGIEKQKMYLEKRLAEVRAKACGTTEYKVELQKERDWAVMGGIADGIAGPAAGVVTALNTMEKNQQIRQQNAKQMEIASMINGVLDAARERDARNMRHYSDRLFDLKDKFVFSDSAENILKYYDINAQIVSNRKSYSDRTPVKINLTIMQKRKYSMQVPSHVNVVMDGTLTGTLYVGQKEIASVIIPLPDEGRISCEVYNEKFYKRELTVACTHYYGDPTAEYRFELDSKQNVWLMEA